MLLEVLALSWHTVTYVYSPLSKAKTHSRALYQWGREISSLHMSEGNHKVPCQRDSDTEDNEDSIYHADICLRLWSLFKNT